MGKRYVTLRVWHEGCWMLDLTDRHRDVTVTARGITPRDDLMHTHALVCACDQQGLQDALESQLPGDVTREVLHVGRHEAEVYSTYPRARSSYEAMGLGGFLVVGNIVHRNGYEWWQVVADRQDLPNALASLRERVEVQVERVADTPPSTLPSSDDLLDRLNARLTPRQLEMLLAAVERNYYAWPRGRSPTEVAHELGISPPTYLEHLRRAEGSLLPDLVRELSARRSREARVADLGLTP